MPVVPRPARPASIAASLLATLLVLTGCAGSGDPGGSAADDTPVEGGTLVYASGDAEPTCLDPHVGGNYPQALLAGQYLETLYTKDDDGKIVPWLASGAEPSQDGLTWTLSLREGIKFTDGTALDAATVKANIEHLQDPDTASSTGYLAVAKIKTMDVVDDSTLKLHLSAPDSALLESFSMPWVAIESGKALKRSQADNCASPVGTGPFTVKKWTKQDSVELTRNEDYQVPVDTAEHAGPAHLEAITWKFIPEAATRYAALQSGTVDMIDNAQPDTIKAAEDADTIGHLDAPRPGASNRIELNSSRAPFNDEKVREAFIRAVDVEDGLSSLFFDTAERSFSALSSVEPMGYSDESAFTQDPEHANRLLDEAGWTDRDGQGYRSKDGQRLSLTFPVSTNQSVPAEQSLFQQLQATAKEVGFEVKLDLLDLSSWYDVLGENHYDLVSAPYTKVGPDVLSILFHSSNTVPAPSGYFANHAQIKDQQLDALLEEASATTDADQRQAKYTEAQKIVLEGHYILPLYDQQNHFLYSTDLHDVGAMTAVASPTFHDAWLAN
ncbi:MULTISPECIES: ABC transporter substrate-binding protein [Micrococcaceae]|uniref:Oligopeptide ABC transporter, periplasmic oligopeptide-binding protein OppA (TC 3.A.1.5.1) n=1 Tax=Arthrobacter rhombi TaxID=71253 RepID=A0A1R4GI51_9MICC|nr:MULTISPECIES: ABC transporter substrate-binding protein [Micrococcaceae]PCC24823.1 peptide ABC transporter substrate-binding protein [Glutamicibacter sp. BW78]SJM67858.1 Oligopeptide ABC transporter, periplasmic oligopeptide-binding protein OppA (TC 3.A.1.5.1) [Arthrobacter rhombi]